jgi:tRNA G18 (ribose-2'-O)-methylase SpoU
MRGYFQIGIFNSKTEMNIGTLWRSAYQLGASGIFTIVRRYKFQSSDVYKSWRSIPLVNYDNFELFYPSIPYGCQLIGVEMGGTLLRKFSHPERAIYLLGSEDNGLPPQIINKCHHIVTLESVFQNSYNVAVAGSLVIYDRLVKGTL